MMEEEVTQHEFDVIIIGAGGAGLRAAIEASRSGDVYQDYWNSPESGRLW